MIGSVGNPTDLSFHMGILSSWVGPIMFRYWWCECDDTDYCYDHDGNGDYCYEW